MNRGTDPPPGREAGRAAHPRQDARRDDPLGDLDLLLRSRHGLVFLRTPEAERADALLRHLADRHELPFFTWSLNRGLRRAGADGAVYGTGEPGGALDHVQSSDIAALYHFTDLLPRLDDPLLQAKVRDAAGGFSERDGAIVITGPDARPPESLEAMATVLALPPPDKEEFRELLHRVLRDLKRRGRVEVDQTPDETRRMLRNLRGLTLLEAEKVLTRVIVEDGRLSPEDVRRVIDGKRSLVERDGLLEYYPAEDALAEIADLAALKEWLGRRTRILTRPEEAARLGLPFPKGILLLGVPGCGKSLAARAVAAEWDLPLLKLDPSALYNKYVGETERNFRRAMETAERMAPCVLFVDELEKAFASAGDGDGGVSLRVLGTFLSWMQDRRGDVFIVATANDVSRLPPELLRKGRFDEVFFVDLPDAETRAAVFEIHLRRRDQDPASFDLARLVEATEGFSGSEIEQAVVAGLYTAFSAGRPLDEAVLLEEVSTTRPLSRVMAERIRALREWARDRTVSAQ